MHYFRRGDIGMAEKKKFRMIATIILTIIAVFTLLPILLLVITSFTDEATILTQGYTFFPKKLSLDSYYYMLKQGGVIARAYGISIVVTVIGTVSSVFITAMLAYPMSQKRFKYRNILSFFVFFTMLFNGGVVSSYIMWSRFFQIKDTLMALIIPNYLVTAVNVFLVRNYYANNIPESLIESAQLDGAKERTIFFKIMLPLAIPTVATVSLFTGLMYWNDWTNGLYYITDARLYGIQNFLIRIMNNIQALKSSSATMMGAASVELPSFSVRMAIALIGILPILIIYPFIQKYLIRGVVIGAVKG